MDPVRHRFSDYSRPVNTTVDFWQIVRVPSKALFAVGRNVERQGLCLIILEPTLMSEWVSGAGLLIANGIDEKLGKSAVYLKADHALVKDPEFIYAAMETFSPANHMPRAKRYGKVTWVSSTKEQVLDLLPKAD